MLDIQMTPYLVASHTDALRGSSRFLPHERGERTRDEPLRASAWEARLAVENWENHVLHAWLG